MSDSAGEHENGLFCRIMGIVSEFYTYIKDFLFAIECTSQAKLHNKTVIITGANTGIGKETALDLAARGARVIIGCRDIEKGRKAAEDINEQIKDTQVIVKYLDLASFVSIRKFSAEILKSEPQIHILINNAGVMACPKSKTEDGFETHFGVNYLGHFLLTNLLLDRIKASAPARIINVSSLLYFIGKINVGDINMDRGYNRLLAYSNSKLANMLFTLALVKRLKGTGGVTVYCVHPGLIDTELTRHLNSLILKMIVIIRATIRKLIFKSPKQGAQTTIYCAVDERETNQTGLYYCACRSLKPLQKARDVITAEKLWKLSEYLINAHNILSGPAP